MSTLSARASRRHRQRPGLRLCLWIALLAIAPPAFAAEPSPAAPPAVQPTELSRDIGSLLQARLLGRGGPTALTAVQVAAAALVTATWAPFAGSLAIPAEVSAWASFAWLAVFAGVVGPLMLFALIGRHGPTRGTSLLFLVPAVTAMVGWVLLREHVGAVAVLGLVVAGVGLWLGRRRTPPQPDPVPVVVAASGGATPTTELCGQSN